MVYRLELNGTLRKQQGRIQIKFKFINLILLLIDNFWMEILGYGDIVKKYSSFFNIISHYWED